MTHCISGLKGASKNAQDGIFRGYFNITLYKQSIIYQALIL